MEDSKQMNKTPKSSAESISAKEIREIFSSYEPFSGLPDTAYEALAGIAERVFIPAGTHILTSGDMTDDAFIVEYGRLRTIVGEAFTVEVGRGELAGLLSVLTRATVEGDLFALRDTKLLRLRGSDLLRVMAADPELIVALSRYAVDAIKHSHGMGASRARPQAFTLLPTSDDPRIREVADALLQALADIAGPGSLIDSRRLQDILGREVSEGNDFESVRNRLMAWCQTEETEGRFLLFVCDPSDTSWTRWCLQQTDRIVIVAGAEATDEIARIDRKFAGRVLAGSAVKVDLLLIQEQDIELPRGTRAWMELDCRRRHHHVRLGNAADFKRAARRMSERAFGVVLGGGGARGLAHIGVLQALEEAGIPIDAIGGTSMGSVMAAFYARGWSPKRILETASKVFTDPRAVMDLDFPMVSILRGRKLDKVLQSLFEDMDISDLWLPYYCISSSLSEGQMMVHDRGPVWQSVRASCSLPGVFPPVQADGQLLVDGGIVNNVPMDIMATQCEGGTVIAVDVGGGGAKDLALGAREGISGWGLLRNRLNPVSSKEGIANILQILIWATTLSSKQYLQHLLAEGRVDLFLTPPVQEFQLLGFDAYEKLYEIGYEYTRKQLAEWDCLQQVAIGAGN
jgi:predicted acylesterase/phospholipase RssA/CRP-like cAMP-binding protein